MTYTVLDLEWDSTYFPKEKRFINQILQIGAVKLDENFNITDTFERTVKSSLSKKVTGRFTKLTGITNEDISLGVPLSEAVSDYNEWLDDGTVTMTWSNSDLYTVIENEKNLLDGIRFKIEYYLDLQSFIQNEMKLSGQEIKSQISLADAADISGIKTDGLDLHTAKDDSILCSLLLKKFYNKERFSALIKDTSKNDFFKRFSYKPSYIDNIDSELIDKKELEFNCIFCGKKAMQKSKWHNKNHCFFANFYCENCQKFFCGRISFKKNYDNVLIKKKAYERKKKQNADKAGNKNELQPLSEKM